jgi:HK97 family phage major capsid protein
MKYADYKEMYDKLNEELTALIENDASDEEYQAKVDEINALNEKWDVTSQRIADAKVLSDDRRSYNIEDAAVQASPAAVVMESVSFEPQAANEEKTDMNSKAYETAWAKMMMGKKLTDAENGTISMVNAALTTVNTGAVIPTSVAQGIWDLIEEQHPLWADAQKTYVNGNYNMIVSDVSSEAAWYDEATATADGSETFRTISLTGCELARNIVVSWKLREMAVEDFIPFIQRKLADKMGKALSYGVAKGQGQPGASDTFKPEPKGIITALLAETNTPQVKTYTAGELAYSDLTAARAKIAYGASALRIYANSKTIWDELANVKDQNGRPIMVADPINGGVGRIFGIEVKEEDALADGEILFSAPSVGYIANVNKDMSLATEEHVKERTADYCAYAIVDGNVTTTKAHALLKNS